MKSKAKELWEKLKKESLGRRSPLEIALGIGIGSFLGVFPIQGFKTAVVGGIACLFRKANVLAIFASSSVISFPLLVPFIYFADYWMGCKLLGKPLVFTIATFRKIRWGDILEIFGSLFLGGFVIGIVAGLVSFSFAYLVLLKRKGINGGREK